MGKYCIVCGSQFFPKKNANLCCSACGWSQIDAILRGRDKYDMDTGKRKKKGED